MQLNGNFHGIDFAHLLQMLASTGKSGRLRVEGEETQGMVLIRDGRIICAVSTSVRESLGSILLSRGWLTAPQLEMGLQMQQAHREERRLGAVLVEAGFVDQSDLEAAVGEQVGQVISEFLRWPSGEFEFEEARFPDCGEVELATGRLPIDVGFAADQILLGLTTAEDAATLQAVPPPSIEIPSLPEAVRDFPAPLVTGEIAQKLLDLAKAVVSRGALFQVGPSGFIGVNQFGIPPTEDGRDFRDLRLDLRQESVLREVGGTRTQYQGELEWSVGNEALVERLGGDWPDEVFVGPLFAGGRVMLVFYGDNLPSGKPIGDTTELSTQLLRSGSMLEHCLLSRIA